MQTSQLPPVVTTPDVERLMKGDMIDIQDFVLKWAVAVSENQGIALAQVKVRELYCYEEDWSKVIFEMYITADEGTAFAYWKAVDDAVWDNRWDLSESARVTLDEGVTIFAHW
jgi:hypothetical protein